ncbi:hypothetical protein NADFUDRAFT_76344 [Nadsonia fulvescens var. elongata DSM 6958]|uniref:Telomere-associated protein Rif1 N-terminal domain-containing protein n=1 Tax=Nadsonia fulvescens var. elongata DSM 6958 TaxID=857566 RepID=A0A1E3PRE8_9ASCO|nr:hypothetical protein NADFUDRAFT_76344 [Nadsonia fulvescens var. elongata DSM 6958]
MSTYPSSSPPSSPLNAISNGLPVEPAALPDNSDLAKEQIPLNPYSNKRVNFSDIPFPPSSSPVKSNKNIIIKSILKSKTDVSVLSNPLNTTKDGKTVLTSEDMLTQSTWYTSDRANHPPLEVMLETACQALEKNLHERKFEIYCSINSALRLNEKFNHTIQALSNHSQKLVAYAKRDLLGTELLPNPLDKRVSIQAIKMVAYIFFVEGTADVVDNELIKWFLIHSIEALESQVSTKSIVGAHLHLLTNHRLPSPKIVTIDICSRFLTAIGRMKTFQSVSILSESFMAYDSLLITSAGRVVLLKRLADWLPRTLSSMVDGNSLIRQKALYVMQTCNRVFLGDRSVAKFAVITFSKPLTSRYDIDRIKSSNIVETSSSANIPGRGDPSSSLVGYATVSPVDDIVNSEVPKIIDLYHQRLCDLLKDQAEGKICMEIWTRIILLLQCWGPAPEDRFDRWEYMGKWLDIGKKGFNSPFLTTRIAAVSMWKYVVYVWAYQPFCQYPGNKIVSLKKNINFIIHPLRLLSDSRFQLIDTLNICVITMLYACIRPCANAQLTNIQLKITWDRLVVPVFESYYLESTHEYTRNLSFQILLHLFSASKTPVPITSSWSLERIIFGEQLTLEDIPSLTPKWVHSNPESILKMIEVVFDKTKWKCEQFSGYIGIELWKKYLAAIKSSIQREVQVSTDTLDTISAVCNFIKRLWISPLDMPYSSVAYFIHTAIESIGIRPFTQEVFSINERGYLVTNIYSRSNKLGDNNNKVGGAVVFLWDFILGLSSPVALSSDKIQWHNYTRLATEYISYVLSELSASKRRRSFLFLGIALSSLECNTVNSEENYEEKLRCEIVIKETLWLAIVNEITNLMRTTLDDLSQRSFMSVEFDFKDCTKPALEWPIKAGSSDPRVIAAWKGLLNLSYSIVSNDGFSSEVESVIIEPLSLYILQESKLSAQTNLIILVALIEKVSLNAGNVSEINLNNKNFSPVPKSSSSVSSLSNMNKLIRRLLEDWYDSLYYCKSSNNISESGFQIINSLMIALDNLIGRFDSKIQSYGFAMEVLASLSIWFKDSTRILKLDISEIMFQDNLTRLKTSIQHLHARFVKIILDSMNFSSSYLSQIACFIVAGFNSSEDNIVKATLDFWNKSFGLNDQLVYPHNVAIALSRSKPIWPDLVLPTPIPSNIIQEVGGINSSSQTSFLRSFNEGQEASTPVEIVDILDSPPPQTIRKKDESKLPSVGTSSENLLYNDLYNGNGNDASTTEKPQTPLSKSGKSCDLIISQINVDVTNVGLNSPSNDIGPSRMRLRSGRTVDSGSSPPKKIKDTSVTNQNNLDIQSIDDSPDFVLKNGIKKINFPMWQKLNGEAFENKGLSITKYSDEKGSLAHSNGRKTLINDKGSESGDDTLLSSNGNHNLPLTVVVEENLYIPEIAGIQMIKSTNFDAEQPSTMTRHAIIINDTAPEELSTKVSLRRSTRHIKVNMAEKGSSTTEVNKSSDSISLMEIEEFDAPNSKIFFHVSDDGVSCPKPIRSIKKLPSSSVTSPNKTTSYVSQSPSKARLLRSSFKKEKESVDLSVSKPNIKFPKVVDSFTNNGPLPFSTGVSIVDSNITCSLDDTITSQVTSETPSKNSITSDSSKIDDSPSNQTAKTKKRRKTRTRKSKKEEALTNSSLNEDEDIINQSNSQENSLQSGNSSYLNDPPINLPSSSDTNLDTKKRELFPLNGNPEGSVKRARSDKLTHEGFDINRSNIRELSQDTCGQSVKTLDVIAPSSLPVIFGIATDNSMDSKVSVSKNLNTVCSKPINLPDTSALHLIDNEVDKAGSTTFSKNEIIRNLASLVSKLDSNEGNILDEITNEDRFRIEGLLMEALWRTRNIKVKKENSF